VDASESASVGVSQRAGAGLARDVRACLPAAANLLTDNLSAGFQLVPTLLRGDVVPDLFIALMQTFIPTQSVGTR
jgi:hypothetical protein